jgi:hypothetical protein
MAVQFTGIGMTARRKSSTLPSIVEKPSKVLSLSVPLLNISPTVFEAGYLP